MSKNIGWWGWGILRKTADATRWGGWEAYEVGTTAARSLVFFVFDSGETIQMSVCNAVLIFIAPQIALPR